MLLARYVVVPLIRPLYEIVSRFDPARSVALGPNIAFGARIAQEKTGLRMATFYLQPAYLRSAHQTPKISGLPLPDWLPRPLKHMVFRGVDRAMDKIFLPELNGLRAELRLPPIQSPCSEWLNSPRSVIGLFPEWFAPPQPDWPPQTRLTGFLNSDDAGGAEGALLPEVRRFLDAGAPPIVFTLGSAMKHGRSFFEESIKACQLLGRRGLLLTRYRDQIPATLPDSVRHVDYLPFSQILPRAAALAHHGGIGTLSQALAAGVPQLVTPSAYDQPDNAARLERLGVGASLPPRKYLGRTVAEKLTSLLASPKVRASCQSVRGKFQGDHPVDAACQMVERLPY
jgi:UDP:flavonoid glycosyltransferase YjiC (YdhE family)